MNPSTFLGIGMLIIAGIMMGGSVIPMKYAIRWKMGKHLAALHRVWPGRPAAHPGRFDRTPRLGSDPTGEALYSNERDPVRTGMENRQRAGRDRLCHARGGVGIIYRARSNGLDRLNRSLGRVVSGAPRRLPSIGEWGSC